MSRALVTGGAGFIGSHLAEALLRDGHQVRVLDNLSTGRLENLSAAREQVDLCIGDIRDLGTAARAVRGVEVVFHQAAVVSVSASVADPIHCEAVNVSGTLNLLLAARDAGVRRIIFASSCAVYGDPRTLPITESAVLEPLSPYGASKMAAELYLGLAGRLFGVEAVILRYFNVFGPRQDPSSPYAAVIPIFISRMLAGQPPILHGDGSQSRDFIYVDDVVRGNLLAAEAPALDGQVFNIASGRCHSLLELTTLLNDVLHTNLPPEYSFPRPGDIYHSWASVERAQAYLGFAAQVPFVEGLNRTASWHAEDHTPRANMCRANLDLAPTSLDANTGKGRMT